MGPGCPAAGTGPTWNNVETITGHLNVPQPPGTTGKVHDRQFSSPHVTGP